jgi:hypothetical protein
MTITLSRQRTETMPPNNKHVWLFTGSDGETYAIDSKGWRSDMVASIAKAACERQTPVSIVYRCWNRNGGFRWVRAINPVLEEKSA